MHHFVESETARYQVGQQHTRLIMAENEEVTRGRQMSLIGPVTLNESSERTSTCASIPPPLNVLLSGPVVICHTPTLFSNSRVPVACFSISIPSMKSWYWIKLNRTFATDPALFVNVPSWL